MLEGKDVTASDVTLPMSIKPIKRPPMPQIYAGNNTCIGPSTNKTYLLEAVNTVPSFSSLNQAWEYIRMT